ncbi:hypothetical protein M0R04_12920 [Candidatus Dojkabacteria bacterium]|jgi:hypothetical protein|nr:hypothetical protein [Candidatus Dojkabacteria bacterium]
MNFEYAQDIRTRKELEYNFIRGKEKEAKIAGLIPYPIIIEESKDRLFEVGEYKPDCKIYLNNKWYEAEIKYSDIELDYLELKKNQATYLNKVDGLFIQGSPTKYTINRVKWIISNSTLETDTYCHKPCYRFKPLTWKQYNLF